MSTDAVAQDQLRAIVERIERMEEEKRAVTDDIKEIYAEAKGNGFDTKVLRQLIKIRKQDQAERMEQETLLELYMTALGMSTAPREDELFEDGGTDPVSAVTAVMDGLERRPGATKAMRKAAADFVAHAKKMGGATISVGGRSVTIEADPKPATP